MSWTFDAEVFRWDAEGASWRFARVPGEVADDVREQALTGGFGSVRVDVAIGETSWSTSLFPEKATDSYLLPVKSAVRKAENIDDGDVVTVRLKLAASAGAVG
jgi:hypothetical protein